MLPCISRQASLREAADRGAGASAMFWRLSKNGFMAWEEAVVRGYEGMVAKDPESRYVPGRTLKWLKVKQKDYRVEERGFYRE